MNVSMALATFYAALHIGPKVSVNLVPAIYTSLPRALIVTVHLKLGLDHVGNYGVEVFSAFAVC